MNKKNRKIMQDWFNEFCNQEYNVGQKQLMVGFDEIDEDLNLKEDLNNIYMMLNNDIKNIKSVMLIGEMFYIELY